MIIHEEYYDLNLVRPVVTIGVFDGVHLGHRHLLHHVVSRAGQTGGESVVITFDPNPGLVLSEKTKDISFLSTLEEKKKLLAELKLDHMVIIKFSKDFSNMEASDFIREILVSRIGVNHLIVGYDNHIGKNKSGNMNKILECAELFDFSVEQSDKVFEGDGVISSTTIRNALLKGKLEDANRWLGYNYTLTGSVVHGRKLGRLLGFPTANIKPADNYKLIPADGIYAVEVLTGSEQLQGVLSIGFNPTVNKIKGSRSVEVHIFDFDGDLYRQTITVIFRFRLRDEKRFDNTEQLTNQMILDKQEAVRLLS